jgi:putative cell-wall hydrolase
MVKVLRKVLLLVALFLVLMVTAAFAVDYGMVTTDVLNFRAGPGTNYEIIGQLRRGEVVRIIGNGGNNWVEIVHNDRQGYVSLAYLSVRSDGETDRGSVNRTAQDGYVTASALNMRSGPSTNSSVLRVLGNGQGVSVVEDLGNGWSRISVDGQNGYVSNSYITIGQASSGSAKGDQVIAFAKRFLGTPYRYGGMSPAGFDCSGFTKYVFSNFGINLGRTTYDQVNNGSYVNKANLQAGDLVLFKQGSGVDHVGIYCGNGTFIHSTRPGDVVKVDSLNSGYYSRYYHSGRRVIY